MGGESEAAWRTLLDGLVNRGLKTPELVIVDGAPGLEKALAALWSDVLIQRCTVHKHRNLLAHAPERLHEEISADYKDMIYAGTKQEIETKRKAFVRKWRLKCQRSPPELSAFPLSRGTIRGRVVLGALGVRTNHDVQAGRLAKPRRDAFQSEH
jgi:transposase-like protein